MLEHCCGDWAMSIRGKNFWLRGFKKMFAVKCSLWSFYIGILDDFSKFPLFIVEIFILIWNFWVIFYIYRMRMLSIRGNDFIAHWAYVETISSHTEHMPNEFSRMLSKGLNFDSFYMDIRTHAECTQKRFHRMLIIRGNDFIACWAYEEMISSLAEHKQKWFHCLLSMLGTDIL